MLNFICQLDRTMEYPDIWSNIFFFLGVSVRVLLDDISI